jgi:hypothetical protein
MGLKTLIEEIYEGMRRLSYKSEELDTLVSNGKSGENGSSFYNLSTTTTSEYVGISGRMRLWKERILPYFFSLPAVELAKNENLEMKVSNNFFRSRIVIYDKNTNSRLKIKAPWFSSLFSRLFGNYTKSKLDLPTYSLT